MKKAAGSKVINIPAPDMRWLEVDVEGTSPLLVSQFTEKAKQQIREAQSGAPKTRKRPPRDPDQEFQDSRYRHPGGGDGFPSSAFKKAMVSACRLVDGLTMTQAWILFRVLGTHDVELVKLKVPEPVKDERAVRQADGGMNLRYRALFPKWSTRLRIRYSADAISAEQLLHLLHRAGESIGVGELRPEHGGNLGCFEIGGMGRASKK
jgi:hypothetical protein